MGVCAESNTFTIGGVQTTFVSADTSSSGPYGLASGDSFISFWVAYPESTPLVYCFLGALRRVLFVLSSTLHAVHMAPSSPVAYITNLLLSSATRLFFLSLFQYPYSRIPHSNPHSSVQLNPPFLLLIYLLPIMPTIASVDFGSGCHSSPS